MAGIDYSKWDKMVAEMSSSDDDNTNDNDNGDEDVYHDAALSSKHANVTRLQKPSSVTIGPQGVTINPTSTTNTKSSLQHVQSSCNADSNNAQNANGEEKKQEIAHKPMSSSSSISTDLSSLLSGWTHNGGVHNFDYLWSQTAEEIVIRFLVPLHTKAKHVQIGFEKDKNEFHCTVLAQHGREWILNKRFARKLKESVEEEAKLEWELCNVDIFNYNHDALKHTMQEILAASDVKAVDDDKVLIQYAQRLSECRFLKVTVEKERINERIIEWWDHVFVDDTKIDLKRRIKDRKTDACKMNDVWKSAHQQFKQKVANFEPHEIVLPDEGTK